MTGMFGFSSNTVLGRSTSPLRSPSASKNGTWSGLVSDSSAFLAVFFATGLAAFVVVVVFLVAVVLSLTVAIRPSSRSACRQVPLPSLHFSTPAHALLLPSPPAPPPSPPHSSPLLPP